MLFLRPHVALGLHSSLTNEFKSLWQTTNCPPCYGSEIESFILFYCILFYVNSFFPTAVFSPRTAIQCVVLSQPCNVAQFQDSAFKFIFKVQSSKYFICHCHKNNETVVQFIYILSPNRVTYIRPTVFAYRNTATSPMSSQLIWRQRLQSQR